MTLGARDDVIFVILMYVCAEDEVMSIRKRVHRNSVVEAIGSCEKSTKIEK